MSKDSSISAISVAWLALMVPAILWDAFVLLKLWGWFAVPAFGVRPIGLALSVGLSMLAASFVSAPPKTKDTRDEDEKFYAWLGHVVFGPSMYLFVGWIAHLASRP